MDTLLLDHYVLLLASSPSLQPSDAIHHAVISTAGFTASNRSISQPIPVQNKRETPQSVRGAFPPGKMFKHFIKRSVVLSIGLFS